MWVFQKCMALHRPASGSYLLLGDWKEILQQLSLKGRVKDCISNGWLCCFRSGSRCLFICYISATGFPVLLSLSNLTTLLSEKGNGSQWPQMNIQMMSTILTKVTTFSCEKLQVASTPCLCSTFFHSCISPHSLSSHVVYPFHIMWLPIMLSGQKHYVVFAEALSR